MSKIPTLVRDQSLPPYSYVPGKFPHPIREPDGHSYGEQPDSVDPVDALHWSDCHAYLRGIDLFNHGFYWEAHESWEAVWNAAGRQGTIADFMKGLIKLAAASVKAREGSANGVARHATRAGKLFTSVQTALSPQSTIMGLQLSLLCDFAKQMADQADDLVDVSDNPIVRIHSILLEPN